jgi:hypothetical protein
MDCILFSFPIPKNPLDRGRTLHYDILQSTPPGNGDTGQTRSGGGTIDTGEGMTNRIFKIGALCSALFLGTIIFPTVNSVWGEGKGIIPGLTAPVPKRLQMKAAPSDSFMKLTMPKNILSGKLPAILCRSVDNMPVYVPDPSIDYKIQPMNPDPNIDYKIQAINDKMNTYQIPGK